jgi:BirA family biotin operon repressor/biotin-[acetyl-CoA-carboxylase] ligase
MTPCEEWQLDTHQLGRRILVYDEVDSTSSRCADLARDESNHGLVVVAGSQTAGRGQYGRSWLCQPGMGVLMSVLLFPPSALRRPAILTAWAAVSVCRLVQQVAGLSAQIKWPNDVLIQGKKICGILIEQAQGIVAGIGLNLNQSRHAFEKIELPDAGSLRLFTGQEYDAIVVARRLIQMLDQTYHLLVEEGLSGLEADWKAAFSLLGRDVIVEETDRSRRGKLLDLTLDGVVLEGEDGYPQIIMPEKVRHLRAGASGH